MNWLRNILKGQGISEEQIKSILDRVKKNYEGYVPNYRFNEVNEVRKKLESVLKERDEQLTEFKKLADDNRKLKEQIEQLQTENKKKDVEYQAKMKDLVLLTAIKLAVAGEVHDPDILLGLLDKSKIEMDENGRIKDGLEDQVKALRSSKAFLFVQKEEGSKLKAVSSEEMMLLQYHALLSHASIHQRNLGYPFLKRNLVCTERIDRNA